MTSELQLSDMHFAKLRGIIHDHTGISIGEGRKSLLLSRLRGHLRAAGAPDFKSYIKLVTSDADALQELIDRVTTNKTYFYRTPRIWEHFRDVAVEDFLDRNTMRPMRIWSAAASTGEEAYTAGIILEDLRCKRTQFDYKILGTDISARVLKSAEAGVYQAPAVAAVQKERPDLFKAHVLADDAGQFTVNSKIRSRISFKLHNLRSKLRNGGPFDVVFLRNVLIYFQPEDQERILAEVHSVMSPAGTLYIGESETLSPLKTDFEIVQPLVYQPRHGDREPDA